MNAKSRESNPTDSAKLVVVGEQIPLLSDSELSILSLENSSANLDQKKAHIFQALKQRKRITRTLLNFIRKDASSIQASLKDVQTKIKILANESIEENDAKAILEQAIQQLTVEQREFLDSDQHSGNLLKELPKVIRASGNRYLAVQ